MIELDIAADTHAREAAKDYGVFWQDAYNIAHKAFKAGASFKGEWTYLPELPDEIGLYEIAIQRGGGELDLDSSHYSKTYGFLNMQPLIYAWREIQPVEPPPLPNAQSFDHKTEEK